MFLQPGTPNLQDYLTFVTDAVLSLAPSAAVPSIFPTATGIASGGSTTLLTDQTQAWTPNQWTGYDVLDVTQNVTVGIASNDGADLTFVMPLANPVQIGDSYLIVPDVLLVSLQVAQSIVNADIARFSGQMYVYAVYNLATDRLVNYAPDVPGQSFFKDLRGPPSKNAPYGFNLRAWTPGVSSQVSDQGTAVGILNPEQMRLLTLAHLQNLRTPWGREYLGIAQGAGRTAYGIS
jgi:hypothetical protein